MAQIPGSIPVTGILAPTDSIDTYPVYDPQYGIDGLRSVADATERNAISNGRRRHGMIVFTQNDGKYWVLNQSPWAGNNTDWTELAIGSGFQGFQGVAGLQGTAGSQGFQGNDGSAGSQGFQGNDGSAVSQGFQGNDGSAGSQGFQGNDGTDGLQGIQGSGLQGSQGYQGYQGNASGVYRLQFSNGDLSSGILTVNHSLGQKYVGVHIYDNNDKIIIPDEITAVNTTQCTIDLTSYTPLSVNWNIVVFG